MPRFPRWYPPIASARLLSFRPEQDGSFVLRSGETCCCAAVGTWNSRFLHSAALRSKGQFFKSPRFARSQYPDPCRWIHPRWYPPSSLSKTLSFRPEQDGSYRPAQWRNLLLCCFGTWNSRFLHSAALRSKGQFLKLPRVARSLEVVSTIASARLCPFDRSRTVLRHAQWRNLLLCCFGTWNSRFLHSAALRSKGQFLKINLLRHIPIGGYALAPSSIAPHAGWTLRCGANSVALRASFPLHGRPSDCEEGA